jgi:hypothetical protein
MNNQIVELGRKFADLKAKSEEAADALKEINAEWDEAEKALLEAMVEEGVKSVAIDGLGLFSMRVKNYLSVNAANKPGFYVYLKESGNGSLLKEEVNPKTLTAFLNGHVEELIKKLQKEGKDPVEARKEALEFLNKKGASYFTDRGIALTKGK